MVIGVVNTGDCVQCRSPRTHTHLSSSEETWKLKLLAADALGKYQEKYEKSNKDQKQT